MDTTTSWLPKGDGTLLECSAHGETFSRLGSCPRCAENAPRLPTTIDHEPVEAPVGCRSVQAHEERFTALAEAFEEAAARHAADPKGNLTNAARVLDVALKARRAAMELALQREDRAHVRWLERMRAAMLGKEPTN